MRGPKPEGVPSTLELLLVHMTRKEFKLCYAICFLADGAEEFRGVVDLKPYATPGYEGEGEHYWTEYVRRAVRYLSFEHDFRFEYLKAEENFSIHREGEVIEDNNERYEDLLEMRQVSPLDALLTAHGYAEEGRIGIPVEVWREAVDLMRQSMNAADAVTDPDKLEAWMHNADQALAQLGVWRTH